jgi:hypothetical protein
MLDPQILVGLKSEAAFTILHEHKVSFGYTYVNTRYEVNSQHENHYMILLGKGGVVIKARIG